MKKIFSYSLVIFLALATLSGCAETTISNSVTEECMPLSETMNFSFAAENQKLTIGSGRNEKGITQWITSEVRKVAWLASTFMYLKIAFNIDFRFTVGMMMTLSIIFFAASVLLGIIQANAYNMLMFVIKLVIIYNLSINYIYFQMYVIQTFEALVTDATMFATFTFSDYWDAGSFMEGVLGAWNAPMSVVNSILGINLTTLLGIDNLTNKLDIFHAVDGNLSKLFSFNYMQLILALASTGFTGIFWAIIMLALMIVYLYAVILCVKVYIMAYIGRFVLYALGPIFISFALFNQTRSLFDGWLQQLISFTLQPVFLFIFFGMFHSILSGFLMTVQNNMNNTKVGKVAEICNILDADCLVSATVGAFGCVPCNRGETNLIGDEICTARTTSDPSALKGCREDKGQRWTDLIGAQSCIKVEELEKDLYWYRLCTSSTDCAEGNKSPIIPIDIWLLISALIMCYLMAAMCPWVVSVANQISSGAVTLSDVRVVGWSRLSGEITSHINNGFIKLKDQMTTSKPQQQDQKTPR